MFIFVIITIYTVLQVLLRNIIEGRCITSLLFCYQVVTFITYQILLTKLSLPNCSYQIVAYQIVTWHFGKWQFGKHTIPSLPNCHLPNCPYQIVCYQNVAYQNVAYQIVTYQIYLTKNPPVVIHMVKICIFPRHSKSCWCPCIDSQVNGVRDKL